jgi:hypothetical protein
MLVSKHIREVSRMVKGLLQAYYLTFPRSYAICYVNKPLDHPLINELFYNLCPPGLGIKQADYYSLIRLFFQYNDEHTPGELVKFSPEQRRQFHTYFETFANVVAFFTLPSTKKVDLLLLLLASQLIILIFRIILLSMLLLIQITRILG